MSPALPRNTASMARVVQLPSRSHTIFGGAQQEAALPEVGILRHDGESVPGSLASRNPTSRT